MSSREHSIQNDIRNELAGKALIFRANVGQAWTGEPHRLPNGDMLLKKPRPFNTGLPPGFSDLFGFVRVTITPDMVGQVVAVFVGLEVKDKAKATDKQNAFIKAVNDNGGRAGVARSAEDAVRIVDGEM